MGAPNLLDQPSRSWSLQQIRQRGIALHCVRFALETEPNLGYHSEGAGRLLQGTFDPGGGIQRLAGQRPDGGSVARRSKHSAQKRRRELARAERRERKRERRANPVQHDAETLIAEYRGLNLPGDVEDEAVENDEDEQAGVEAAR